MKLTFKLFVASIFLLVVGFFLGYGYQLRQIKQRDLLIANTVGNNLSETNRLYSILNKQGPGYQKEQNKYNQVMLTIVDCGNFIGNVKSASKNEEIQYLVRGLQDAIHALEVGGIDQTRLVLCQGVVLELVGRK